MFKPSQESDKLNQILAILKERPIGCIEIFRRFDNCSPLQEINLLRERGYSIQSVESKEDLPNGVVSETIFSLLSVVESTSDNGGCYAE